jgi:hypothetical protein
MLRICFASFSPPKSFKAALRVSLPKWVCLPSFRSVGFVCGSFADSIALRPYRERAAAAHARPGRARVSAKRDFNATCVADLAEHHQHDRNSALQNTGIHGENGEHDPPKKSTMWSCAERAGMRSAGPALVEQAVTLPASAPPKRSRNAASSFSIDRRQRTAPSGIASARRCTIGGASADHGEVVMPRFVPATSPPSRAQSRRGSSSPCSGAGSRGASRRTRPSLDRSPICPC